MQVIGYRGAAGLAPVKYLGEFGLEVWSRRVCAEHNPAFYGA